MDLAHTSVPPTQRRATGAPFTRWLAKRNTKVVGRSIVIVDQRQEIQRRSKKGSRQERINKIKGRKRTEQNEGQHRPRRPFNGGRVRADRHIDKHQCKASVASMRPIRDGHLSICSWRHLSSFTDCLQSCRRRVGAVR
jgi:hypothetical protein